MKITVSSSKIGVITLLLLISFLLFPSMRVLAADTIIYDSSGVGYDISTGTLLNNDYASAYLFGDNVLLVTDFKKEGSSISSYPWNNIGENYKVRFTNNVDFIGAYAFTSVQLNFIGDLIIPNSVTSIGDYAFSSCTGFTGDLVIPDSVISIGTGAFDCCEGFTGNLKIGASVQSIGNYAFDFCSGFTGNLVLPNSVQSIGKRAFEGCSGFTGDLVIPDLVTTIRERAFYDCRGFTGNLVIPDSVTTIDTSAFNGCTGFTGNLIISDSVTTIGASAFNGCTGFTGNLLLPKSLKSIGSTAFGWCRGFTGNLTIPDKVTTIGRDAFYRCTGFSDSLIIPDSVTTIESSAFCNCTGITTISIGSGLCSLPDAGDYSGAFYLDYGSNVETKLLTENEYVLSYYWAADNRYIPVYYNVNYVTNGGSSIDSESLKANSYVTKPQDPIRKNFVFLCWTETNPETAEITIDNYENYKFDFASNFITNDITLYAVWLQNSDTSVDDDSTNPLGGRVDIPVETEADGTTKTDFTVDNLILGGDLVVSIPAEMILTYDSDKEIMKKEDYVSATGRCASTSKLEIKTLTSITYANETDNNIKVPGTIAFGTASEDYQITEWSALELLTGVKIPADVVKKNIAASVLKSDIDFVGTYSTTILYNIAVLGTTENDTI